MRSQSLQEFAQVSAAQPVMTDDGMYAIGIARLAVLDSWAGWRRTNFRSRRECCRVRACHAGWVEDGLIAELRLPSPVVEIDDDRFKAAGVRVLLKRDDLIHPEIPGNKWRKLKYNIATAQELGFETLLTFGGAYSNHVRATAAVGSYFGFSTVMVRLPATRGASLLS